MRRFKSVREKPALNSQINVTNLVDVALTVLIMFILVAPLLENGITVDLPKSSLNKIDYRDTVNVTVAKGGTIYFQAEKVDRQGLLGRLRPLATANPKLPVNVLADAKVVYQDLVSVLDTIRQAGVVNVGLATEIKARK